jgi:protoheme IX farnesyltransferase
MTQLTGRSRGAIVLDRAAAPSLAADYLQLAKPRLTLMVVITAFVGFAMGATRGGGQAGIYPEVYPGAYPGAWSLTALIATLVGTALSCVGAGIFNQVIERATDAKMRRTMDRPLPTGRISGRHAVVLAAGTCLAGVLILAIGAAPIAALLAAVTIAAYVFVYTPLKRVASVATIVGAFPGALPPVIGYAGATGGLGVEAYLIFALMFLWQLPHFLSIAWLYRDEYARAGIPVLPVENPDPAGTSRQIVIGCLALLPLGVLPVAVGVSGTVYLVGSLIVGAVFLAFGVALAVEPTRRRARALFFVSLFYLPVVLTLMLIDRV